MSGGRSCYHCRASARSHRKHVMDDNAEKRWNWAFSKWFEAVSGYPMNEVEGSPDGGEMKPEIRRLFSSFLDSRKFILQLSYTRTQLVIHILICLYLASKLSWCPPSPIYSHASDLASLAPAHPAPISLSESTTTPRAAVSPEPKSPSWSPSSSSYAPSFSPIDTWIWNLTPRQAFQCAYPRSYFHLSYHVHLLFHLSILLSHIFNPRIERALIVHFLFVVNGSITLPYFFSPSRNPYHTTDLNSPQYTNDHSQLQFPSFQTVAVPLLLWCLFLLVRRGAVGLYVWEHECHLSDSDAIARGSTAQERSMPKGALNTYRTYCILSPVLVLTLWLLAFRPALASLASADLRVFPGMFWTAACCMFVGFPLAFWINFLTFQYQCLGWTREMYSGAVLLLYEGMLKVGIIR
ncbi:hypothetical protein BJ742DRAFT_810270 [Cladochytrium replicatum]|nr:hypothetical protein BJ742DRAFT_810270 [Cladochytrium replicatum]